jgi:peptidyl-prolyl cis-trans isomerase D
MLGYIRKKSGGIFSVLIIGAIALVFIFWGIGSRETGAPEDIKIDGRPVGMAEYSQLLNNIQEQVRSANGPGSPPLSPGDELLIRQQALYQLLMKYNYLGLAGRTGRAASVADISQTVKSNPLFRPDGQFSLEAYRATVLNRMNMSLAAYEAEVAESLLVDEVDDWLRSLSFVSRQSVLDDYHFRQDKVTLDYVYFPDSAFPAGAEPTDDELSAYYEVNKETWRVPAMVRIAYAEVKLADFAGQVEVTQSDLEDAYAEERASLSSPESAEVRHILLNFPSLTPTEAERAAVRARADEVAERLKTEDFSELASELSDDAASAAAGGSLGVITRGETMPQFEEAVFDRGRLALGAAVGPVESLLGLHFVVVDRYQAAGGQTLEEAREQLTELVTRRKERRLAVNKIEDLIEAVPSSTTQESFANTAKSFDIPVGVSGFFSVDADAPAFFQNKADLIAAAVGAPVGQVADPVDGGESFVLYAPLEKRASFLPGLDDAAVRAAAAEAWKAAVATGQASEAAAAFLASDSSADWAGRTAALPEGVESASTPAFARGQVSAAGAPLTDSEPRSLFSQYFRLGKVGDAASRPVRVEGVRNKGWLVVRLADLELAEEKDMTDSELSNLRQSARVGLAEAAMSHWNAGASQAARIDIPPSLNAYLTGRDLVEN